MLTRPRFIYFTIMWEVHKVQDYQKPSKNLLAWAWDGHMTHRGWLREAAQSFEMLKAGTAEGSRHRKSLWLDKQSNCIHVTAVDGLSIDLIGLEHTYKEIVIPEEYLPRKLKKKKKKGCVENTLICCYFLFFPVQEPSPPFKVRKSTLCQSMRFLQSPVVGFTKFCSPPISCTRGGIPASSLYLIAKDFCIPKKHNFWHSLQWGHFPHIHLQHKAISGFLCRNTGFPNCCTLEGSVDKAQKGPGYVWAHR